MNDEPTLPTVGLSSDEIMYFATVFAFGAAAGFFRSSRDRDFVGIGNLFSIAVCSGFLGFSSVALLCRTAGAAVGYELLYLGVASFVGLLGKEQDQMIQWGVKHLFHKLGINPEIRRPASLNDSDENQTQAGQASPQEGTAETD